MGTLEDIGRHLGLAVKPLRTAVSSPDSFKQFIYRLGWNASAIPPSYSALIAKVEDALTELEALIANPDVAKALRVFDKVKAIVEAIDALTETPPGVGDPAAFLNEIKDRIIELLLTDYLSAELPDLFHFLRTVGVVVPIHSKADAGRPSFLRLKIDWDAVPDLVTHPDQLPQKIYGWGTPDLDTDKLFSHLLELIYSIGLPVSMVPIDQPTSTGYLQSDPLNPLAPTIRHSLHLPFSYLNINGEDKEIGLAILPLPQEGPKLPGIIIQPVIPSEIGATLRIRDDLTMRVAAGSNIGSLFGLVIRPGEISVRYPFQGGTTLPDFGFGAGVDYAPADPTLLLGSEGSTRIQLKGASSDFTFRFTNAEPEIILGAELKGLALILQAGESDGFIKTILGSGETTIDIPLGLEWSSKGGLKFKGGGGFEVSVSPHLTLGPVSIDQLLIRLLGDVTTPPAMRLTVGASVAGDFGPLAFVVENIGLSLKATFIKGGNAGPFDITLGFKPPDGIGLAVDSGVLKGGGFLRIDAEQGEYIGSLELEFQGIFSLKAVGIIDTKMPDGSEGFSLLIIITAEFSPVQLGLGFTLNGVGGLLGLNRTTKIDVLREGIKTNALKSILFPEDVVANINRIVSDLKQVFPPLDGRFIVGPMAEIGWGTPTIITLELGLLLEIPVPRIVILGVLKALLPDENAPLLRIQVNFLGVIDFQNKYISFDASLYDSRLLAFTLTGDMAFRLGWGDHPLFILSVGGFHPAFKDAPADLQQMVRITISLLSGSNPRITIQCYYAVTSNTVQFGAKAELYAEGGGFNIYGFIGYDVLFQFDPFHFVADLYAGLALRQGTSVLMGISLSGELAGPTPWDVKGSASISILFFDITVSFHETWGDRPDAIEPASADVLALLTAEVNDVRNWKAEIPDINHLHVTVKQFDPPPGQLVIHPFGIVSFSQRLVPLDVTIDKFGSQLPKDEKKFGLTDVRSDTSILPTDPATEQFARANFFAMSDNEKLSSPSFELMPSGFRITASSDLHIASPVSKSVDYELTYLRKSRFSLILGGIYALAKSIFFTGTKTSAVSRSGLSFQRNRTSANAPDRVAIPAERFVIANVNNLEPHAPGLVAESYTEANEMYNQLVAQHPDLKNEVQILSEFELQAN